MGLTDRGISLASGFKYQAGRPLDVRTTVENTVERDELISSNAAYLGMRVYVKSVDKSYYYTASGWKEVPIGAMYTHPSTHPATMITEDTNHRFMTDAERTKLQNMSPAVALTRAEYEALKESGSIDENTIYYITDDFENLKIIDDETSSIGTTYSSSKIDELIKNGSATVATKATQDSAGQQITSTYIKGLSVSGKVITYTKGDGTTGTITTQDTTYSTGTTTVSGITKLYTNTGTNTDGTMTQKAITDALAGKSDTSHTHNYAGSSSAGGAANSVANAIAIKLNGGTTEGTNLFTFNGSAAKTINITPSAIGAAASSHGTHVTYSTDAPKANGTASAGSSSAVARADHVHPLQTSVSGSAGSATNDSAGQNINATYIKGLSVSGKTITYTKGDGSTGTITTQDTTYSTGTASTLGLTKLYTGTGTATDGTITQKAITDALAGKANSSHTHTKSQITDFPTSYPATMITEDTNHRFMTDAERTKLQNMSPAVTLTRAEYEALKEAGNIDENTIYYITDDFENLKIIDDETSSIGTTYSSSKIDELITNGSVATSTKATQDSAGQKITTTYIKGLSVSGKVITYTKGDGTTGTITTQDTNTTYPISYKTINGSYKTAYRTQTKGNTSVGDYISTIRNDTSGVSGSPQNGSGLAWGREDTHGYLYVNYSNAEAYIGGGNGDKLNWVSGISLSGHSHTYSSIIGKPDLLNCMRMYGGTALDSKGTTADSAAQYNTIALSTATANASGFSKVLTDLPKGKYSVMIRMKISSNSSSNNVIKVQCGDTNSLSTFYVRPNMFNATNTYQTFGFIVEHTTTSFTASLSIGTALSGATVNIDYLSISLTFTAISVLG